MLGFGALGQFPLGGGPYGTASFVTIGWFHPLSGPVRFLREPRAAVALNHQTLAFDPLPPRPSFGWFEPGNFTLPVRTLPAVPVGEQQFFAFYTDPLVSFAWFNELSKPQKLQRIGLGAPYQETLAFNPRPFVSFGWYGNLSEPQRFKRGLRAPLQQFFTIDPTFIPNPRQFLEGWFANLSLPVRIKLGLLPTLQQFYGGPPRLLPTPTISGTMHALETKDTFLAGAMTFNTVTSAEIGVIDTSSPDVEIGVAIPAVARVRVSIRMA